MSYDIRPNKMYFYSPYGLGDSMMICAFSEAINRKYENNTMYLFKPSHQYVAEMYALKNYELVDETFDTTDVSLFSDVPQVGKIYMLHPEYTGNKNNLEAFFALKKSFKELYADYFEVPITSFKKPKYIVEKRCQEKLIGIPIDKLVVVAPEMNAAASCDRIPLNYYHEIIEDYKRKGYEIIVNARKKEVASYFSEYCIDFDISEFVWIAKNCDKVILSRSGMVDILAFCDVRMEVLYPNAKFYEMYNLKRTYGIDNVIEHIVERG